MNDLQLKQAVIDELEFDPAFDAAHIGVFAHDGAVTLTGYVDDYAQKHAAENAARRVKGVKAVAQELEVRLAGDKKLSDDEIAARAAKLLDWDLHLTRESVAVTVEDGVVRLSGEVSWDFQRREAEADVRKLGGVVAVINHLSVCSNTDPGQVKGRIRAALERAADLESERISVRIDDQGAVVLSGQVRTLHERAAAENAAWSAPGVTKVVNQLQIGY